MRPPLIYKNGCVVFPLCKCVAAKAFRYFILHWKTKTFAHLNTQIKHGKQTTCWELTIWDTGTDIGHTGYIITQSLSDLYNN